MPIPYNLFPLYCATPMSVQIVIALVQDSASDPSLTSAEFALIHKRDRLPTFLTDENLGNHPPNYLIQSDFIGESLSSIARYTAQRFQGHHSISSSISIVLDEQSKRDATCIIVKSILTAPAGGVNERGVGEDDGFEVLHVRIPFALSGCLFGIHTGLGLLMDDMIACADRSGVFRL
ncbi:hypothetical protein WG66_007768 [Moniliophthora roreri]|uniref:Uncharacterized protein n=1 Tax=Moniliophthora roreri TaxID=221103 RepID=A0A0W0FQ71_MONRR|nr:hypothetical protein WG66_007768 [Moniliophthora roreri]